MAETPEGESTAAVRGFLPHHSKDWDGSLFPLSLPSQPPDIRNWFSSYVYESPESLGLPDGVGSDALLQEEDGETQYPMKNSSGEERVLNDAPENGKRKLDSLLDENHYRGNDGFPSDFGLLGAKKCLIKGSASSPERSLLRVDNKEQVSHQDHPIAFNPHEEEDESYLEAHCFLAVKNKDDSRDSERSRMSKSTFKGDLSDISQMLPMEQKDCSIRNTNTGSKQKSKVSLRKLLGEELLASHAEENGNSLFSSSLDRCPSKDSPCIMSAHPKGIKDSEKINRRSKEVEDESHQEEQFSLDKHFKEVKDTSGFISTKNKEKCRRGGHDLSPQSIPTVKFEYLVPKTEITSKGTHESLSFKNGASKEDHQSIRENRSPLRDRTNYRTVEAAPEMPGKWQCPRRAKAGEGPPMKQLRLDRWFHLLNCNSKIK